MPSELRIQRDLERKHKTREELIVAASKTFVKRGYHKTLISDIVSTAQVGQGTFYRNFSSKRELFEVIFDRFFENLFGLFNEMSENMPQDLEQYMAASQSAVSKMAQYFDSNREITLMFLREANSVDREFEEKMTRIFDRFAFLAQYFLDDAISKGFARSCRSDVVSHSLVGIGLHMVHKWSTDGIGELSPEELSREIVKFAFQGFGLYNK